jgi:hypothetical protein
LDNKIFWIAAPGVNPSANFKYLWLGLTGRGDR